MARFILTIISCLFILTANAQSVQQNGKTFTQVSQPREKKPQDEGIKTEYIYIDSKGKKYSVYLSSRGKAYIKRPDWKSGKQYLPEVGKKINPKAYEK